MNFNERRTQIEENLLTWNWHLLSCTIYPPWWKRWPPYKKGARMHARNACYIVLDGGPLDGLEIRIPRRFWWRLNEAQRERNAKIRRYLEEHLERDQP